jgi:hypothetical protein
MNDAITPEEIQAGLLIKIVGRGKHVNGKFNEADYIAVRVTSTAHRLKNLDLLDQPLRHAAQWPLRSRRGTDEQDRHAQGHGGRVIPIEHGI